MPTEQEIEAAAEAISGFGIGRLGNMTRLSSAALEAAERVRMGYPSTDLAQRCAEIIEWQKTGILTDGRLRALAEKMPHHTDYERLRGAEDQTAQEAMHFVIERVRGDGWMPIESAPKDCRAFLAIDNFAQQWICTRTEDGQIIGIGQAQCGIAATVAAMATHWRPLPPPPKASEGATNAD